MSNKKWILIFLILILVSLFSLLFIHNFESEGNIAVIRLGGETVKRIDLSAVKSPYTFTVGEENETFNTVLVTKEGISVTEASCPDKVCIRHGILKNAFSPIVCLPNNLTITLEESSSVDALSK